ncbi:MAG: hypothetical protein ACYTAS_11340 [Planctomycetota bacterium]|jgi:hypothetical protein
MSDESLKECGIDKIPESTRVVILSRASWKDHLDGSLDAVGKRLRLTTGRLGNDRETVLDTQGYTFGGVL